MAKKAGFIKKHVNDAAISVRSEMGLSPWDPLDPRALAAYLEIPIADLSGMRSADHSGAAYLLDKEMDAFSAVTVFSGARRHIVHNDSHSWSRQNSNICHELSHGLLFHEPVPALSADGLRDWNQVMEDEAQWMAGALLLPESAVLTALRKGQTQEQIALRYGVSGAMVRWRINETGASTRVARERASRMGQR